MSSCDCTEPDAYTHRVRTCRKPTTCDECLDPIERGEKYNAISGIWDGEPNRFSFCLFCDALRRWIEADADEIGACECIPLGELYTSLSETFYRDKANLQELYAIFPRVRLRYLESQARGIERMMADYDGRSREHWSYTLLEIRNEMARYNKVIR